tara:strand:- start:1371 stop:1622 length:252 start_codon:yes stop_codon:yes gene_type:complete
MDDLSRHMAIETTENINLNKITDEKLELLESIMEMVFGAAGADHLEAKDALEMVRFVDSWRNEIKDHRASWIPPSHWEMAGRN